MPLEVEIKDPENARLAKVSDYGELVVGDVQPSTASFQNMDLVNTAYNFVTPKDGYDIFITGIHLYANKNVGVGDATVIIYANGTGADDLTTDEILFESEMLKQTNLVITGLKLKVTEKGMWVNGKTSDDDVFANIFYYYAEA